MTGIGEGVAYAATIAVAAYLTKIDAEHVAWLWALVVLWAFESNWGVKK